MHLNNILLILLIILLPSAFVNGQSLHTRTITNLDKKLSESSGLLILDGRFITFNDSGNKPELYEIDTTNGNVKRTVELKDAKNVDWEAITADQEFIYVGDFGNNSGDRKDLKIYIIAIQDFLEKNKVKTKEINLSYSAQTSFEKKSHSTIFDAEAMVAVNDRIFMFSKNWENNTCYIYNFPKIAGDYVLSPKDSIVLPGKVCDAAYDRNKGSLYLIGHSFESFVVRIPSFMELPIDRNMICTSSLVINSSFQTEGIAISNGAVYYTSEFFSHLDLKGVLGEVPLASKLGTIIYNEEILEVIENYSNYLIKGASRKIKMIEVFNENGEILVSRMKIRKEFLLEKSKLSKGTYHVIVNFSNKETARIKIIVE